MNDDSFGGKATPFSLVPIRGLVRMDGREVTPVELAPLGLVLAIRPRTSAEDTMRDRADVS